MFDRARALISQRFRPGALVLAAPSRTREFLRLKLDALEHEVFAALFLDNRHRLIEYVELFRGTIDGAQVHPREVVKEALARNAAALILPLPPKWPGVPIPGRRTHHSTPAGRARLRRHPGGRPPHCRGDHHVVRRIWPLVTPSVPACGT